MITREQATAIANGDDPQDPPGETESAAGLLEFVKTVKGSKKREDIVKVYMVDIEDVIYRVFNEVVYKQGAKTSRRRTVTLGRDGNTINIVLFDRLSEQIDDEGFERGCRMVARNASLDVLKESLLGTKNTAVSRLSPSGSAITDFSKLHEGDKNVDILGRVIEVSPVRYVTQIGRNGQTPVSDCRLTDSRNSIDVNLWGSSALIVERMHVNDTVKIEFCSVRNLGAKLQISANDLSRVLIMR